MSQNSELDWSDVDADILSITNYFGGELSAREAADVEDRVVDDDEFFAKVGILIKAQLLVSPVAYRGMRVALDERAARIREDLLAIRVMRSAWPDIDERLAEPLPPVAAPAKPGPRSVTAIEPRSSSADDDGRPRWRRLAGSVWRNADRLMAAALVLSVLTNFSLAFRLAKITASVNAGAKPPGAATPSGLKLYDIEVTVPAGAAPRVVGMPNGASVTVMPGSRITYDTTLRLVQMSLEGEASFHLPARTTQYVVFTPVGGAILTGGDFAIRSSGNSETLITVSRGRALVMRDNALTGEGLQVTSGFVRVTRDQPPAVVTQGTDNFPRIPPR